MKISQGSLGARGIRLVVIVRLDRSAVCLLVNAPGVVSVAAHPSVELSASPGWASRKLDAIAPDDSNHNLDPTDGAGFRFNAHWLHPSKPAA